MLRTQSYLLVLALLALGVVVALMVVGVVPAERSSVLGALVAGEPAVKRSEPTPTVTPINGLITLGGLRPGVTDAFVLREGPVILQAEYDGRNEPFSAYLRALDDAQPQATNSILIVPPLDRRGAASDKITKAGWFVLTVELAGGEWTVTVEQPS